ncbi:class I SAM-dependent methyltransferase [Eisenbergiella porci]|uniref:class I SAM-dependent methyltransferase n=1 Tax=Eisenbergiella porci TaxID=2652274 RepID=UPI002A83E143|nr:class I SAM-dependent methyltransferase [Eisenbergiella porci]
MNDNHTTQTLNYYNQNAARFSNSTQSLDFASVQDKFLSFLPPQAHILDFGCGPGRDIKYFLAHGYPTDAIDGSGELCRIASQYTGIQVKQMLFQELNAAEEYDGIWACSSILHSTYNDLKDILKKLARALKKEGILYMSFKYGDFEGIRNGRYFIDMTEDKLQKILQETDVFQLMEKWISSDVRPGRDDEKWMNMILVKKSFI